MKILFNKAFLVKAIKLAAPVIGGQLGVVLMGTTDTIMCGKVSTIAQAAVGLGSAIYFLFLIFGMGLYQGITTLVSIADGANEREQSKKYLVAGLWLIIPTTLVINFCIWASSHGLYLLNLPTSIVEETRQYLSILLWGTPGILLFLLFSAFLNGLSKTVPTMVATFIALVANYFFNDILIFGKIGFTAYGFAGSVYATNLSRYLLFLLLLVYFVTNKESRVLLKAKLNYSKVAITQKVCNIGIPIGFQVFIEMFAFTASFITAGWIGEIEVATHQNVLNIASVTFMFVTGISVASNIMIGNGYGAKDKEHIKDAAIASLILMIITEIIFAAIFIFGGNYLLGFYTTDLEILKLGAPLMVIAAAFQLSDGLQNLGLNMLRGIKDVKIPATITLICYWLLMIPLSYVLAITFKLGLQGIWWGFVIGLSLASIFLLKRFYTQLKNIENRW